MEEVDQLERTKKDIDDIVHLEVWSRNSDSNIVLTPLVARTPTESRLRRHSVQLKRLYHQAVGASSLKEATAQYTKFFNSSTGALKRGDGSVLEVPQLQETSTFKA